MKYLLAVCTALLLLLTACQPSFLPDEPADKSAVRNFEQIWSDFDAYYGLFDTKHINWDSLYAVYRPQVQEGMDEAALYQVVTQLLGALNDHHVTLFPTNSDLPRWSNDLTDGVFLFDEFDLGVVSIYVTNIQQEGEFLHWAELPDQVGYIHIGSFPDKKASVQMALDKALTGLAEKKTIILDIRDCPGGFDPSAQYVAGRFAQEKSLYMTTRKRNGPKRSDFGPVTEWYVEPTGGFQYTKPVLLLTTRATGSAGETFTLAMKQNPRVRQVGTTTSGAFSDNIMRETWNGWLYTISVGDYRAADGKSYEAIGIVPEVVIQNQKADILDGKDKVLEKALSLVQ